jgi:hypothetical protein
MAFLLMVTGRSAYGAAQQSDVNIATIIMAQAAQEGRAHDVAMFAIRRASESVAYSPDVKTDKPFRISCQVLTVILTPPRPPALPPRATADW